MHHHGEPLFVAFVAISTARRRLEYMRFRYFNINSLLERGDMSIVVLGVDFPPQPVRTELLSRFTVTPLFLGYFTSRRVPPHREPVLSGGALLGRVPSSSGPSSA
jgi:hypothetical protein